MFKVVDAVLVKHFRCPLGTRKPNSRASFRQVPAVRFSINVGFNDSYPRVEEVRANKRGFPSNPLANSCLVLWPVGGLEYSIETYSQDSPCIRTPFLTFFVWLLDTQTGHALTKRPSGRLKHEIHR